MASALAAKMGLRRPARSFNVRICTMESDMEFSCEVCFCELDRHQMAAKTTIRVCHLSQEGSAAETLHRKQFVLQTHTSSQAFSGW